MAIGGAVRPLGVEVRAGLHAGEVEVLGDKVTWSRSTPAPRGGDAGPSQVLVSQTGRTSSRAPVWSSSVGEYELKGVPDRWRLYRVVK
jgi:class 3 adenylate cyclase